MHFAPNNIYHVYNQGNNRQTIFHQRSDYLIFLNLYKRFFSLAASTIAWCLMPNHFHIMIYADERCNIKTKQGGIFIDPVTNGIRKLLSNYARIFNNRYRKTGSLFRQKTKAKCISAIEITPDSPDQVQDYFVNCFHYTHQNPLMAKLVKKLEDWEFSSFQDYAGLRKGTLCQKDLAALHCGYDPDHFIEKSYEMVNKRFVELFN